MTPREALLAATSAGAGLSVNSATRKLVVEWDSALEDDILAALTEHRDWLVAHLLHRQSPPRCRPCGRAQHAADYACPNPSPADPSFPVAPPYWPPTVPEMSVRATPYWMTR